jgi:multidrug resistance protein, MATE family
MTMSENALGSEPSLSWEKRPLAELVRLSWPITLSSLSYSVMTLVDTLLIGKLGPASLAGVGLAGVAAFTILCFSFGLLRGVKTLVAQAIGAEQRDQIGAYLGAALIAAAGMGAMAMLAGQLVAELLSHIAKTAAAGEAAREYLKIRILGAPFALGYVALREVRYAQGDARTPMYGTILANLVNVTLAYTFVYHFHWGVAGAAWATVIAHFTEFAFSATIQHLRGWGITLVRKVHLVELWRIGMPTGLQFSLEVGAFAMLTAMLAALGDTEAAAHQIALQVIHFSFLPAVAVSEAGSVLAGQAVGANRDALVMRVAKLGLLATTIYTGACTLVLAIGAPLIVSGFTEHGALADNAIKLLYVAAVFQIFDGANLIARGALRGTGDVRYAAFVGIVSSWLFTPPLAWLLGWKLGLGAFGGWLGLCAEIIAASVLLWWRLGRKGWLPAAAAARVRLAEARARRPVKEGAATELAAA